MGKRVATPQAVVHLAVSIVAVVLAAGCGATGGLGSILPSQGATASAGLATATPSAAPDVVNPEICPLLPLGDVQALSPFQTGFERAQPTTDGSNGCEYLSAIDAQRPVRAQITMSALRTADEAREGWQSWHDEPLDDTTVTDIDGLGDSAFVMKDLVDDEDVVWVLDGRWLGTGMFRGEWLDIYEPKATAAERIDAAVQTLKLLLTRLPEL